MSGIIIQYAVRIQSTNDQLMSSESEKEHKHKYKQRGLQAIEKRTRHCQSE